MGKERTLDELRQVKDSVYVQPKIVNDYYMKINFDSQYIIVYPNDQELGKEIRNYYNSLKG
jgi:hypothetical protein